MFNSKDGANLAVGLSLVVMSVIALNTVLKPEQAIPIIPAGKVFNEQVRTVPTPLSLPIGSISETIKVETSAVTSVGAYTKPTLRGDEESALPCRVSPCLPDDPIPPVDSPLTVARSGFALPIMYSTDKFRYNVILEGNPVMPWADVAFQKEVRVYNDKFPVSLWKKSVYGEVTKLVTVEVPAAKGLLVYRIEGIQEGDIVYVEYTPALYASPFASIIDNTSNDPITLSLIPVRFLVD
jgi:hypothetical protein